MGDAKLAGTLAVLVWGPEWATTTGTVQIRSGLPDVYPIGEGGSDEPETDIDPGVCVRAHAIACDPAWVPAGSGLGWRLDKRLAGAGRSHAPWDRPALRLHHDRGGHAPPRGSAGGRRVRKSVMDSAFDRSYVQRQARLFRLLRRCAVRCALPRGRRRSPA